MNVAQQDWGSKGAENETPQEWGDEWWEYSPALRKLERGIILLEEQSGQISSPSDLKRHKPFWRASIQQEQYKKKKENKKNTNQTSSDMGSVPDPKLLVLFW